jgi:hypothetical protein
MMAIRKQFFEWELIGNGATWDASTYPTAGSENSIFYGDYGLIAGQTSLVKETQFVVIEKIASSPGVSPNAYQTVSIPVELTDWSPNIFLQVVIDTTGYYRDPQNLYSPGISGMASSYPSQTTRMAYYDLWPPIYVLPDQTWDIRYTLFNDIIASHDAGHFAIIPTTTILAQAYVEYTLFSETDAVIARKLLNLGVPVTTDTAMWFRRLLLKNKGLDTETWEFYLKALREERKESKKNRRIAGLARRSDYE